MTDRAEDPTFDLSAHSRDRLARIRTRMSHPAGVPIAVEDVEFLASLVADLPGIVDELRLTANTRAHSAVRSAAFDTLTVLSILDECRAAHQHEPTRPGI